MRATARIVAVADTDHGTRLAVLSGQPPLLPRRTGPTTVHLVGGAAGPLGGDRLRIEIEVGPGAELTVHTVAASIALPGRDGALSRVEVTATVAGGGCLRWLPEPLVAAAGCHHEAVTTVDLAAGARLVWRDELVCGRHREEPGDLRVAMSARLAGRPLYRTELSVGPGAPGWAGGAVLGGARAHGSLLLVNTGVPEMVGSPDAALLALTAEAWLATAVGGDLRAVRGALDPLVTAVRPPPAHRNIGEVVPSAPG